MINVQFNVTLNPHEVGEARLLELLRSMSSDIASGDMAQGQLDVWLKRLLMASFALEGLDPNLPRKLARCDDEAEVLNLLSRFIGGSAQVGFPEAHNLNELGVKAKQIDLDLHVKDAGFVHASKIEGAPKRVSAPPVTEPNMSLGNIEAYAKIAKSSLF